MLAGLEERGVYYAARTLCQLLEPAIRAWRARLGPEPWHYRVHDALVATERTVAEICRFVQERYLF